VAKSSPKQTVLKPAAPSDCGSGGTCGCHPAPDDGAERLAAGFDGGIKASSLKRLKRIEGQVRGLHKMVDEGRYCADVLTQLGAVQEALRAVGRELVRNHLKHCAAQAIRAGGKDADRMYDELVELMYKNAR
jgi:DNA-binding FrmR family transcriptional regulator